MSKTRTPQNEEYLEILVRFSEKGKEPKVKDIAKELGVSPASVSEMLKKLSKKGLISYERYGKIMLTPEGENAGRAVLRKHRLIEKFLILIGVKKAKVHDEACVLEHAVSDDVERALRKAMWNSGKPEIDAKDAKRLTELKKGSKGEVLFIAGGAAASRRLVDMGLTPGTKLKVTRGSSRAGPMELSLRSSKLSIGRGLAEKVFVRVEE